MGLHFQEEITEGPFRDLGGASLPVAIEAVRIRERYHGQACGLIVPADSCLQRIRAILVAVCSKEHHSWAWQNCHKSVSLMLGEIQARKALDRYVKLLPKGRSTICRPDLDDAAKMPSML